MISNVQQITMPELREWAAERGVEIVELDSPDLCGNRIFSATHQHETRIAKVPANEAPAVRAAWNERLYRELSAMSDIELRRYIFRRSVYRYPGPQT
ncbi:hypothetical protein ACFOVU_07700 [Nocardiopsis sediminis]|uniref:Uncharacterized protein n=1 Tax=Nocardiopsis sediminis TaxID=1778267 RepID=A0ABV8FM09_9ACTN